MFLVYVHSLIRVIYHFRSGLIHLDALLGFESTINALFSESVHLAQFTNKSRLLQLKCGRFLNLKMEKFTLTDITFFPHKHILYITR